VRRLRYRKREEPQPIDSGAPKVTHQKKESREGIEEKTHRWAEKELTDGPKDEAAAMRASPPSRWSEEESWRDTAHATVPVLPCAAVEESAPLAWPSDGERTREVRRHEGMREEKNGS
jgi:hypothetical protein